MSQKLEAKRKQLEKDILRSLLRHHIETGELQLKNGSEAEIIQHLERLAKKAGKIEWSFGMDHTGSLLDKARRAVKDKEYDYACLYYATYVEHKLNRFVHAIGRQSRLPDDLVAQLVRKTDAYSKFIWIHVFLAKYSPPRSQLNRWQLVSEHRNQFVHYKWKTHPEEQFLEMEKKSKKICLEASRLIKYIGYFENKYLYLKAKPAVENY